MIAVPRFRGSAAPFLSVYPLVILAAGLLLGFRFRAIRLLGGLVVLLAVDRALVAINPDPVSASFAAEVIALLLPVNFALLLLLHDGPILRAGQVWLVAFALQVGVIAGLARMSLGLFAYRLALPVLPIDYLDTLPLPQIPTLFFIAGSVVIGWKASGRDPAARGLLWALVASLVAFNAVPADRTLYFATAGFAIVVAMVESSYALAFHDDLTGLPGRRAFSQKLATLQGTYVVAMVDVDHFKQFNDRHGHDVGDQVLRLVANRLSAIEGGGLPFRYGGEEFAVIFPETHLADAAPHLEMLRTNIEATIFTLRAKGRGKKPDPSRLGRGPKRRDLSVTVSIGIAESTSRTTDAASVVKRADEALYRAKGEGRNRVIGAPDR